MKNNTFYKKLIAAVLASLLTVGCLASCGKASASLMDRQKSGSHRGIGSEVHTEIKH